MVSRQGRVGFAIDNDSRVPHICIWMADDELLRLWRWVGLGWVAEGHDWCASLPAYGKPANIPMFFLSG